MAKDNRTQIPLSMEDIVGLGKEPEKKTRIRKAALDTSIRTFETWFKLHSHFGVCSNPNCLDQRPMKVVDGNAVVAVVNDKEMCRICFLAGFDND